MEAPDQLPDDVWLGVTAFISERSDYTTTALVARLPDSLPACSITLHPQGVEVIGDEWQLWLYESVTVGPDDRNWAEFAEGFQAHPRSAEMMAPGRRLEFAGQNIDAGDNGWPAAMSVATVLASFRGVFVFDAEAEEEVA